jgi:hypothetical protein
MTEAEVRSAIGLAIDRRAEVRLTTKFEAILYGRPRVFARGERSFLFVQRGGVVFRVQVDDLVDVAPVEDSDDVLTLEAST